MAQDPTQLATIQVSPQLAAAYVPEPPISQRMTQLATLAPTPDTRRQLVCQQLLVGDTLARAQREAEDVLPKILENTQVLAEFGKDALDGVNRLSDRMLRERPPVDVPELNAVMKQLSRDMRGIGKKYDPNDPNVLAKYEGAKRGLLSWFRFGKTFLQELLDDIRSMQEQFQQVTNTLSGKQLQLLKNVAYYDAFYRLNEMEIDKLIYKIGVMEILRDRLAAQAARVPVGDGNLGDRGGEQQAHLLELVTYMENKIIAFKGRLWVAWAMAPQVRTMRGLSAGFSLRIDQTIEITIPTMKNTIVVWLTLNEAQQAEQFNRAVEEAYNQSMEMFAHAAQATVPVLANALATPALDPRTVKAWAESLSAQADGIVNALELGRQKRAALEEAMIVGKGVIDAATQRVNEAQLEHALAAAKEAPLEIARSVPAQT